MTRDFQRYALYFTRSDPLGDFGARWLGWDPATGTEPARPDLPDLPAEEIAQITKRPQKYGFHATLKPPFRLADAMRAEGLLAQLDRFCRSHAALPLPKLTLAPFGRILALTLSAPCPALDDLAAQIVREFDPFRAPLTQAEWDRRTQRPLSPEQRENLRQWGYPHVMGGFQFHMTLTGPLKPDRLGTVQSALSRTLAPLLEQPATLDAISLLGEDPTGRFHLIARTALTG